MDPESACSAAWASMRLGRVDLFSHAEIARREGRNRRGAAPDSAFANHPF
jgi:hypothetical protein